MSFAASCVFCGIIRGEVPAHLVLDEPDVVGFLDQRPLFPGHVLIVPREHHRTLADLPADQVGGYFAVVRRVSGALPQALDAQGTFVAVNNVVSQSVPHLHTHVVPRTKADGLRGFFWPRTRYADDGEATRVATVVRNTLAGV